MLQSKVLPPLRDKPYGGAWSIHDSEAMDHVNELTYQEGDRKTFINDYRDWMSHGKDFVGLSKYEHIDFCAGTTEAFGQFYYQHMDKRLRLYKGEYFYHWLMARNYFKQSEAIGEIPLAKDDVVVISCPFSGTGNIPKTFYEVLEQCESLKIPVMLDLAYINITDIQTLNLDYDCIEVLTTSLSKVFPVETNRIGRRLRRNNYDDSLCAYNQNNYVNLYSVNIGHNLIKKFDNKWLTNKYRSRQKDLCWELGIKVSDSVIFGLAKKGNYDEYDRGGEYNRLCFSRLWDGRLHDTTDR